MTTTPPIDRTIDTGRRTDTLRRHRESWLIARREMILEQNVLLAKNLSILF